MKIHVLKLNLLLLFILFSLFVSAQEICNNGIDDDGDSYIDLADSDCGGSSSQCAGNLNSVVNVTFGTGTTGQQLNSILSGATTVYTAYPAATYAIRHSPSAAHNSWFSAVDHTPNDVNGRMLLILTPTLKIGN